MEILCSTFLVILLFLSNNEYPENFFLDGRSDRILPFNYFLHINKVETGILPNEFKHIIYKDEFLKKYPNEWF